MIGDFLLGYHRRLIFYLAVPADIYSCVPESGWDVARLIEAPSSHSAGGHPFPYGEIHHRSGTAISEQEDGTGTPHTTSSIEHHLRPAKMPRKSDATVRADADADVSTVQPTPAAQTPATQTSPSEKRDKEKEAKDLVSIEVFPVPPLPLTPSPNQTYYQPPASRPVPLQTSDAETAHRSSTSPSPSYQGWQRACCPPTSRSRATPCWPSGRAPPSLSTTSPHSEPAPLPPQPHLPPTRNPLFLSYVL